MQLYIVPGAPNARKVQAVVNHLGITPEIIRKDFFKQEMQQDDYKALNPNAKTPLLVDGDLVLWESEAINQYLCDITPNNSLLPTDAKQRANITRWQSWSISHYNRWLATLCWECLVKEKFTGNAADQKVIDYAMGYMPQYLSVLNNHLEGREFMAGNSWSLADYSVALQEPFIGDANLPFSLDDYPNVAAFYARMASNPHWQATAMAPEQMGRAA